MELDQNNLIKLLLTTIATSLTIILVACAPFSSGVNELSSEAKSALAEYRSMEKQTYNVQDEALFGLFAEDAVIQACGSETLQGREELRDFF